ncbi:MAG: aldehyde dehydrogenase [Confluentimicrobium sp.]|jgi:betaine-aldehyde dehydrogenase|nr:aldehyde dehydrogenase [Actibacterium sp.]
MDELVRHRALYWGGDWHAPQAGRTFGSVDPSNGDDLGAVPRGDAQDADRAVAAAREGFEIWRHTPPQERARLLRQAAQIIRENAERLAYVDAADGGNPISKVRSDVEIAAKRFEFFAGLITELKGDTVPGRDGTLNLTTHEPVGVVARIVAFNHPFMFSASRLAAPLAAGNACVIKPPEQASLSALILAELIGPIFPPGVVTILTGQGDLGAALSRHPGVDMVTLVGSVPTGKVVMQAAAETLKPVVLELGGKNALIAYPDADPEAVAEAMVDGMNFTWCGQSCGSTSRAFLHADIHDAVLAHLADKIARFRPDPPLAEDTSMGCLIDATHHRRVLDYIETGIEEGARLIHGGGVPDDDALSGGCFVDPTVFADVTPDMRIAREEIFGPVLSVLRWTDEPDMLRDVNALPYGLTCAIWTDSLRTGLRAAGEVRTGYVWINDVSKHIPGMPFGGVKQSGIGREESLSELYAFTVEKALHVNFSGTR